MGGSALRKLGFTALGLALLVVLAILISSAGSWRGFQSSERKVGRARLILQDSAALSAGLLDAETGQRGFLLTGRDAYLAPYYAGASNAAGRLRGLVEDTRGETYESRQVNRLEALISDKLAEMQRTVDARKTLGFAKALEIVETDRGKVAMDEIRRILNGIDAHEYALFTSLTAELREYESRTLLTASLGSLILLFLLVGAIAAINRHSYQRDRLIADLDRSKTEIAGVRDLFQTTLGSIGDAVIATDGTGLITFINPVAQSLTGWIGQTSHKVHLDQVFRIVNQQTRQTVESPVSKVLRTGGIVGLANHTILIGRDGKEIHIDDSGAPIRDRKGRIIGVVLVFRDITERRRAEIEAEHASRQTADILASIGDGFLSFDSEFRILFANSKAGELLDVRPAEAVRGNVLWTECPFLAGTRLAELLIGAMKDRAVVELEDIVLGRWLSVRAYPAQNGLSVYLVDITEKKRIARDLETSRRQLSRSLSAAKAAGWEWDLRTSETVWSGEFCEVFGNECDLLLFDRAVSHPLLHPEDRQMLADYTSGLTQGGPASARLEFRILRSGEVKWIGLLGEVVEIEHGKPSRLAGLAIDITDRRSLEDKLREAAKLESLGILAGGIAHDFNNLLTGILGNASLALEVIDADSSLFPALTQVVEASQRAADLTRQMLAYSGRGSFILESLNLSREVGEIVTLLRASVGHGVDLKLNLDPAVPRVEADPAQIQQLVMNLVINAAEAVGDKHGSVTVTTGTVHLDQKYAAAHLSAYPVTPGVHVFLEVSDTGHGMDEATRARIFDPFFSTKFTGRGLGLAAVQGIVRGLKAGIQVDSAPGAGSTFRIFLPAGKEQPERVAAVPAEPVHANGAGTVLIADDESIVQRVASRALERNGFSVLIAGNGHEAVDLLSRHAESVSLIILDLTMPLMSGEQTLAQLRRVRPDIAVLATSGCSESDALHRFGGGVEGFLQKPFTSGTLMEHVSRLLKRAGHGR